MRPAARGTDNLATLWPLPSIRSLPAMLFWCRIDGEDRKTSDRQMYSGSQKQGVNYQVGGQCPANLPPTARRIACESSFVPLCALHWCRHITALRDAGAATRTRRHVWQCPRRWRRTTGRRRREGDVRGGSGVSARACCGTGGLAPASRAAAWRRAPLCGLDPPDLGPRPRAAASIARGTTVIGVFAFVQGQHALGAIGSPQRHRCSLHPAERLEDGCIGPDESQSLHSPSSLIPAMSCAYFFLASMSAPRSTVMRCVSGEPAP